MFRRTALVLVMMAVALGACSNDAPDFSDDSRKVFLEACNPTHDPANDGVCGCSWDRIQAKYSYKEYAILDRSLQRDPNALPEDLAIIFIGCRVEAQEAATSTTTSSTVAPDSSSSDSSSSDANGATDSSSSGPLLSG